MLEESKSRTGRIETKERAKGLDAEKASHVLFWSYYFSQGSPELQNGVLEYLTRINPELRLDDAVLEDDVAKATYALLKSFVESGPHQKVTQKDMSIELSRVEALAKLHLTAGPARTPRSDDALASDIVTLMIQRDARYVESGRDTLRDLVTSAVASEMAEGDKSAEVEKERSVPQRGPFRPHVSHFVEYVILAHRAPGPAAYEKMFAALREKVIMPGFFKPPQRDKIVEIVRHHNAHHPDEQIDVDELLMSYFPDESGKAGH